MPTGYEFSAAGDCEDDPMRIFAQLYERMRRELGRKYLEETPAGLQFVDASMVRGVITWDEATDGRVPRLVVDGRDVSWEELGRMLMTCEGFHFRLQIFDASDDPEGTELPAGPAST